MKTRILRICAAVFLTSVPLSGCGEDGAFVDRSTAFPGPPVSDDAMQDVVVSGGKNPQEGDDVPPASITVPRIAVDQNRIILTEGVDKSVFVSIDQGNGSVYPAQPGEISVSSSNPAVVSVVMGAEPGQLIIVPLAPGQSTVTIATPDDVKSIPVEVVPGVPVVRLGVNFEDIPTGGDFDYNDAVFCFSGKFAHSNQAVVSLEDQQVRINVTNRSGCDHWISIAVVDPDGTIRSLPQFRSRTQPVLDLRFYPGSKLDVKMLPADQCLQGASWVGLGGTVTIPGPTYGQPLVEVLNDVCRTTGS
jgi:hypothetical protein